jgi:hypothetical protein
LNRYNDFSEFALEKFFLENEDLLEKMAKKVFTA